jgi:predicted MFS family arabinose efflux permease
MALKPSTSRRRAGAATLVMQAAGCAAFILSGGSSAALMLLGVVLFGLGIGVAISVGPLIAQAEFSGADTARAIALATAVSQAAYAFAPAAFGLVRDWSGPGTAAVFLVAAALQIVAAAIYLLRPRAADA